MKLAFVVLGKAEPAGSKRAFAIRKGGTPTGQVAVSDANPRAKGWQQEVRYAAIHALNGASDNALLDGPLGLRVRFYRSRPAGHMGTGKNAGVVKASAPAYPISRPDATKILRGLEDALTGTVWRDDAQVVVQDARKLYGEPERTEVEVWQIGEAT